MSGIARTEYRQLNFILCATFVLTTSIPCRSQSVLELARENRDVLVLSNYITVDSVNNFLDTQEGRERTLKRLEQCGVTKIYLDLMRSGEWADEANTVANRDYFRTAGLEVAAGITTSPGQGFGVLNSDENGYCWTHPQSRADLRRVAEMAARHFDEVIVDDFFTFRCFCERCDRARGGRDWEEFHLARMTQLAQEDLIEPIHSLNPNCKVVIKYPQWYDKFHEFGYDIANEVRLFDAVFAGTESRNPRTERYGYVEPFEGFFNYSWIRSIAKEKMIGGWYDYGDITPDVFREQGYQTILAGAREIVLFAHYFLIDETTSPYPETTDAFIADAPSLFHLARTVSGKAVEGLHVYKPIAGRGNNGEYYLFDYLGMMGLSIVADSTFPKADSVLFSLHSLKDPELPLRVKELDRQGIAGMTVTAGLLNAWADEPELLSIFGYELDGVHPDDIRSNTLQINSTVETMSVPLHLRYQLYPRQAQANVHLKQNDQLSPILTSKTSRHGGIRCVLNLSTYSQSEFDAIGEVFLAPLPSPFMNLPQAAVDEIRAYLDPTSPRLSMPVRFGRYRFTDGLEVWENFNDESGEVRWDNAKVQYAPLVSDLDSVLNQACKIPPRNYVIVRRKS